jgi:recombination endonuclease VII
MSLWYPPYAQMTKTLATDWRGYYVSIKTRFQMEPQDYRDLYIAQHGVCYICRVAKGKNPDDPKGKGGRRLGVDHNHALGDTKRSVRGLLCTGGPTTCNRIIGWLNVHQLRRAVELLETAPAQTVFSARGEIDAVSESAGRPFPDADGFLASCLGLVIRAELPPPTVTGTYSVTRSVMEEWPNP